ncbi:MAG: methyl-accepting chemotaxis protein [bacterium]|nr:methyl-accepting chemotaxis protein [bacterium]
MNRPANFFKLWSALLTIIFITVFHTSKSQNLSIGFDHITTDNGLSTGTVNCIFKDKKGYVWIGTVDGLNRYNAYEIEVFKNDPKNDQSIAGNVITSIAEDADGRIWITTRNKGISIFDWQTESFTNLNAKNSNLPVDEIKFAHVDSRSDVLIGTIGGGLARYDKLKNEFELFQHDSTNRSSISSNAIHSILEDQPGKYWLGCNSGAVDYFDIDSNTSKRYVYNENYNLNVNRKELLKDQNNMIWVGTDGNGIYKLNPTTEEFTRLIKENSGLTHNIITFLFERENGQIWIGTDGEGINIYDPIADSFQYIKSNTFDANSLSSNAVYDLYKDDSGLFWISTFRGGVNMYSPFKSKFRHFKNIPGNDNSLSFNSVISVAEGPGGKVWIGTDGGGLDLFDPRTESFTHYRHSTSNRNTLGGNVIKAIYEDSRGVIWTGTYSAGMTSFDPSTGRYTRYKSDPNNDNTVAGNNIWAFHEDDQGNFWVGVLGEGLDLLDRETGNFIHHKESDDPTSISGNIVKTLFEDSKGNFWVGTESKGINIMDREKGTFRTFKNDPEDSLSIIGNNIHTIFEDSRGQLLIGTGSGLCTFDYATKTFREHPANRLLRNNVVLGIQEDAGGNLWISTNFGMAKYDPKAKDNESLITSFDKNDGLQGNEFNYTSSVKTSDGLMVFGGTEGFNIFRPERINYNSYDPNVIISGFSLFDTKIGPGDKFKGDVVFTESLMELEKLELNHKQNVFEIQFASLDYTTPSRNKYKYKLEPFDDDWIIAGADQRRATYMNLPPDEYTFIVNGTNNDGNWSSKPRVLQIVVTPPIWGTWWFRISMLLLLGALLTAAYQWRVRSLKSQRIQLRTEVAHRTAELDEMISIIRTNSEQITETGNTLKLKSGQLANDAKTQDDTAKGIVEDIENVTVHTRKNDENAQVTNDISSNTVKQLEHIRTATLKNIQEIKAISNKILVLEEIFKQTNILAINASIEAARAGEYGAGFSVIASEVRKLAERSKEASSEIVSLAKKGVIETEQVGALILDFIPEVQKSASLIQEISRSSQEQSSSIENVNRSLKSFFQISRQNSAVSGEIYSISSELDSLANYLNDKVKEI